jgi:hypothetical protein
MKKTNEHRRLRGIAGSKAKGLVNARSKRAELNNELRDFLKQKLQP